MAYLGERHCLKLSCKPIISLLLTYNKVVNIQFATFITNSNSYYQIYCNADLVDPIANRVINFRLFVDWSTPT